MSGSHLTADQARNVAVNPDLWAQYFRTIDGKPFSLNARPYLVDIYRHFQPHKKNESIKMVVLKCSRKVEKTETICNLLMYGLLNIPYFNAVYTAPRQPQVTRFMEERLNGALMSSINGGCLLKQRGKSAVSHQTYDVGASQHNHLYAHSSWGDAHGLLGIECDLVCVDEFQDVGGDVLPMLTEMMALSEYKWAIVSGTAREQGSEFWKLWDKTTKNEWSGTEWVETNPGSKIVGYHMTQLMHPDITEGDIDLKRETYSPRRFANEVLGEFWAGETKPVTHDMLLPLLDREKRMLTSVTPPNESYMGVDWGGSTTWIIIDSDKTIIAAGKIDSRAEDEVEVIKELMLRYNVVQCVADTGYGARQIKQLQEEFDDRLKQCYYSSRPMTPYEYKKRDNNRNPIHMCVVDRTTYVERLIESIHEKEITIPWADSDSYHWLLDEFCALNSSREADESNTRPVHNSPKTKYGRDGDDHAFHSLLYAALALEIGGDGGIPEIRVFGA